MSLGYKSLREAFREGFFEPFHMLERTPLIATMVSCLFFLLFTLEFVLVGIVGMHAFRHGAPQLLEKQFVSTWAIMFIFFTSGMICSYWLIRKYWQKAKIKHPFLTKPRN